ncbi:DNA polymerase V [Actimicrobium sp. GrIS 1.19]|uniref:LexA family protein n=1 Tax=Actimicrobium sp. GrIS 1.19 TaxID=3071708 RepID=UPI002E06986A|nr:DNA polymerase V [Actimicrobium sp. GrIS 1.19]
MPSSPRPVTATSATLGFFQCAVPAGFPSPAADHTQKRIDLNEHLLLNKDATFLFRVTGESMRNIDIFDGDTILVDRSLTPRHGHIVLAIVDEEFTVKRLHQRDGVVRLLAENPAYASLEFKDGQELRVWGVVTCGLRKLLNA